MAEPRAATLQAPAATRDIDAWRAAIAFRRRSPRPSTGTLPRRRFIVQSFWLGLGVTMAAAAGSLVDYLRPRGVSSIGGPAPAGHVDDYPAGGDPRHFAQEQFYVVNLDPADIREAGSGGGAGLLALWHRCPHLGCTVPWQPAFSFHGETGWFRCPCHRSTYTRAGVLVAGPAPRSMDTMRIEVDADGNLTVMTGDIVRGGTDNPRRAIDPTEVRPAV